MRGALALVILGLPVGAAAETLRVAMIPIVVHSSSGETDYLSNGMAEMLSARLERGGEVQVIRLGGEVSATADAAEAVAAGRAAGAQFVVFGSFTQFGSGASLDIRCARVGDLDADEVPDSRHVFIQSGALGDIIPRLDDLSGRIVKFLKDGAPATDDVVAPAPTPDAGALADLESRVEQLEQAVYEKDAAAATEAPVAEE